MTSPLPCPGQSREDSVNRTLNARKKQTNSQPGLLDGVAPPLPEVTGTVGSQEQMADISPLRM